MRYTLDDPPLTGRRRGSTQSKRWDGVRTAVVRSKWLVNCLFLFRCYIVYASASYRSNMLDTEHA